MVQTWPKGQAAMLPQAQVPLKQKGALPWRQSTSFEQLGPAMFVQEPHRLVRRHIATHTWLLHAGRCGVHWYSSEHSTQTRLKAVSHRRDWHSWCPKQAVPLAPRAWHVPVGPVQKYPCSQSASMLQLLAHLFVIVRQVAWLAQFCMTVVHTPEPEH